MCFRFLDLTLGDHFNFRILSHDEFHTFCIKTLSRVLILIYDQPLTVFFWSPLIFILINEIITWHHAEKVYEKIPRIQCLFYFCGSCTYLTEVRNNKPAEQKKIYLHVWNVWTEWHQQRLKGLWCRRKFHSGSMRWCGQSLDPKLYPKSIRWREIRYFSSFLLRFLITFIKAYHILDIKI